MGVLSFSKKAGDQRLINACRRALDHQVYNYKIIDTILKCGLDKMPLEELPQDTELPLHKNIRGENYYQ
jgi:hypothetical protein